MTLDEARGLLTQTLMERRKAQASIEEAATILESSHLIIQGLVRRFPGLAQEIEGEDDFAWDVAHSDDGNPRGAEAPRLILQANPNKWYRVSDILNELEHRGWMPNSANPANAIRTALERLVASAEETDVVKERTSANQVAYSFQPDRERGRGYDEEPF